MKSWENNGSIQIIPENCLNNFRRSRLTFLYAIVIDKNNQRVHLNTVKNEDLKYIGNYLGTINKNHHGTGNDHNKKHNIVSSSLSTINDDEIFKNAKVINLCVRIFDVVYVCMIHYVYNFWAVDKKKSYVVAAEKK